MLPETVVTLTTIGAIRNFSCTLIPKMGKKSHSKTSLRPKKLLPENSTENQSSNVYKLGE